MNCMEAVEGRPRSSSNFSSALDRDAALDASSLFWSSGFI